MGILERKEREHSQRRLQIMDCTKALILEQGSGKVSMMEIAARAELSKATLYLYFPSKETLFREICEEAGRQFNAFFQSRLRPGLSALESLKLVWRCFLEMFGASDDIFIFFSMKQYLAPAFPFIPLQEGESPPGDSSYLFYGMIRDLIAQGAAEGFFDPAVDPGMVARTILSLFSYMVENTAKLTGPERRSLAVIEELQSVLQIILRGIAGEKTDRSSLLFS